MIPAARKERIKNAVKSAGFVSASELAAMLNSSLSTVRRDLIELERDGSLVRTRGGGQRSAPAEAVATSRVLEHSGEKIRIARKALELIADAGCIVLDAGTTTLAIARLLYPSKPLCVITDGIEIAYELRDRQNTTVCVCGGILYPLSYNLCSSTDAQMPENMRAEICVMGAVGLSVKAGLTKYGVEAPVKRRLIDISQKLICVVDSSKIDATGWYTVCPIDQVDMVITDLGIRETSKAALEAAGCEVLVV